MGQPGVSLPKLCLPREGLLRGEEDRGPQAGIHQTPGTQPSEQEAGCSWMGVLEEFALPRTCPVVFLRPQLNFLSPCSFGAKAAPAFLLLFSPTPFQATGNREVKVIWGSERQANWLRGAPRCSSSWLP